MTTQIVVPALGESVTEATVSKWLKSAGDAVSMDEPLVELETDKVTLEVPASAAGVLGAIEVGEGETVEVGAVLGSIDRGRPPAERRQGSRRQEDRDEGRHPHRRGDAEIRGRGQGARRGISRRPYGNQLVEAELRSKSRGDRQGRR